MDPRMFGFGSKKRDQRDRVEPVANLTDGQVIPSSDSAALMELFGSLGTTASGATVNEATAMQVAVVYACVSRIAGAIATLPLAMYERSEDHNRKEVYGHPVWWLLNEEPCPAFGAGSFWEYSVTQMLLRGDSIAYIHRGPGAYAADVKAIIPIPRSQVQIQRVKTNNPRVPSKLIYTIHAEEGHFTVDQGDVLHFPSMGFNGITSMSAIQYGARNAIGTAIRADDFAGQFFAQGAQPQHAITAPGQMTPTQQEAFRAAWAAKYMGTGPNGIPLILTEGLDIKELSMTAADAQLLESRKWQVIDIARAFGVPPFMVGETEKTTSFGSGVEHMGQWFVTYTLKPHLKRIQDEINRKLWPRGQKYFVEFDVDGLLQGDTTAQGEYYTKALGGPGTQGWMAVNEVRRKKNLPPIPGWDEVIKAGMADPESNDDESTDERADAEAVRDEAGAG